MGDEAKEEDFTLDKFKALRFISDNWERAIFAAFGFIGLYFCLKFLFEGSVNEAGIVFVLAFFSFFYSNLARFKRFKGLGFEAELWEDRQKEAEILIERLKRVVTIYTNEIVLGSVKRGRIGAESWKSRWNLFEELIGQHDNLGQKIDFSDLKSQVDTYFLFDMCGPIRSSILQTIGNGKREAEQQIRQEFGRPPRDLDAYNKKYARLNEIRTEFKDSLAIAQNGNLAFEILKMADESKIKLSEYFDVSIEFDEEKIERLRRIAELFERRPITVTEELISWADREN